MDIKREIELLKQRFTRLGATTDWGAIYNLLLEMHKMNSCYDEQGNSLTDEQWEVHFTKEFMTREDFIKNKDE